MNALATIRLNAATAQCSKTEPQNHLLYNWLFIIYKCWTKFLSVALAQTLAVKEKPLWNCAGVYEDKIRSKTLGVISVVLFSLYLLAVKNYFYLFILTVYQLTSIYIYKYRLTVISGTILICVSY